MICRFACALLLIAGLPAPAGAVLTINGTPVAKDPNDPLYAQISNLGWRAYADLMIPSTETFPFQSIADFSTHCNARNTSINTITRMKPGGGINFGYGATYADRSLMTDLYPNPAHPGVYSSWFKAKKLTTKASSIAQSVEFGTTNSDCRAAVVCAVLIAHNNTDGLGAALVDAQIPPGTFKSDTLYLVQNATDTSTIIPGDVLYMVNDDYFNKAPAYQQTLPNGKNEDELLWNGEWVICVGPDSYVGLGVPARSEAALRQVLRNNLEADADVTLNDDEAKAQIKFTTLKRPKIFPRQ